MSDIQSFRQAVEAFIAARGWTPTRFGRAIAGDPLFVFELREGREPRSDTRARILKAMQEHEEEAALGPMRLGIAGLGNVGATLVRIIQRDGEALSPSWPQARHHRRARATARATAASISGDYEWFDDPVALAKSDNVDLFVELIGGEDGRRWLDQGGARHRQARHHRQQGPARPARREPRAARRGIGGATRLRGGGRRRHPVIKTLREGLGSAASSASTAS